MRSKLASHFRPGDGRHSDGRKTCRALCDRPGGCRRGAGGRALITKAGKLRTSPFPGSDRSHGPLNPQPNMPQTQVPETQLYGPLWGPAIKGNE